MATAPNGRLIMFDGPDGVGKTTQIARTRETLEARGFAVHTTRSHGGTPIGEMLRDVSFRDVERQALTDHYISMAIHAELRSDIAQHRRAGEIVLVDRSPLSNWAYQVTGSELHEDYVLDDIRRSLSLFAADVLICYYAPLPTLRQHTAARDNNPSEDYFESKSDAFFTDVIKGYEEAAKMFGATMVNASGTIEQVHTETMAVIEPSLSNITR